MDKKVRVYEVRWVEGSRMYFRLYYTEHAAKRWVSKLFREGIPKRDVVLVKVR